MFKIQGVVLFFKARLFQSFEKFANSGDILFAEPKNSVSLGHHHFALKILRLLLEERLSVCPNLVYFGDVSRATLLEDVFTTKTWVIAVYPKSKKCPNARAACVRGQGIIVQRKFEVHSL